MSSDHVGRGGRPRRHAHLLASAAMLLGLALLLLALTDLLVPWRHDLFGLSRVFAPYLALLFLPVGALGLVIRGRRGRLLGAIAFAGLALAALRFVPSMPITVVAAVDPDLPRIDVASWNLYRDAVSEETLIDALAARAPGIVSLQELTPERAAIIAGSAELRERFPYQVLRPADTTDGMGLLSSWPVDAVSHGQWPPLISATVTPPHAPELAVIAAHAPPPELGLGLTGPGYDPERRDLALEQLRAMIDRRLSRGQHTLLLGDLNLTDREVAYDQLSAGLVDAHLAAGTGLGHTWRPPRTELPFGLLRIDMALAGPGLTPLASAPDCSSSGADHCILDVTLALAPTISG